MDPNSYRDPFGLILAQSSADIPFGEFIQYGILGILFVMLIMRVGIMTVKAHTEVVDLLKDAVETQKARAEKAEQGQHVAIQAAEAATAALQALKMVASERRDS